MDAGRVETVGGMRIVTITKYINDTFDLLAAEISTALEGAQIDAANIIEIGRAIEVAQHDMLELIMRRPEKSEEGV